MYIKRINRRSFGGLGCFVPEKLTNGRGDRRPFNLGGRNICGGRWSLDSRCRFNRLTTNRFTTSRFRHSRSFRLHRNAIVEFKDKKAFEQQHADTSQYGYDRKEIEALVCPFFFHAAQSRLLNFNFQLQTVSGILCGLMKANDYSVSMDALASLCKRRGFIFQTSEIYGGINGFWDYGPLGVELKRNIKESWWKATVQSRENVVGLDSAIIMHPKVWEASGHIGNFKDPMIDCRETKSRYRADQLLVFKHKTDAAALMFAYPEDEEAPEKKAKKAKVNAADYESVPLSTIALTDYDKLVGPDTDKPGTLTEPHSFNLMFKTFVGPMEDSSNVAWLRPETAQGIFAQFANVLSVSRQ